MSYRVFLLDDTREIEADVVCRTAQGAFPALEKEEFDHYIFDHDLGLTKNSLEVTGLDVLRWALRLEHIKEECVVELVTANPVGRKSMSEELWAAGFRSFYHHGMWRRRLAR